MLKKYAPYIVLLIAALLLFFVKRNQHGGNTSQNLEITANTSEGFSRRPDNIIYTQHSRCRMGCRHITEEEVKDILENGKVVTSKIEEDARGKTYPIDGKTKGDKLVRIVVAPRKKDLVIVTVIDLDTDWPCDCTPH